MSRSKTKFDKSITLSLYSRHLVSRYGTNAWSSYDFIVGRVQRFHWRCQHLGSGNVSWRRSVFDVVAVAFQLDEFHTDLCPTEFHAAVRVGSTALDVVGLYARPLAAHFSPSSLCTHASTEPQWQRSKYWKQFTRRKRRRNICHKLTKVRPWTLWRSKIKAMGCSSVYGNCGVCHSTSDVVWDRRS